MEALATWLRHNLWAAFLTHQAGIFLIAILFLSSVRRITGRTIHLGRDPIGLGDGAAIIVLSIAVILLTRAYYRWIKGDHATPLGIALSPRRFLYLVLGIFTGFAFAIAPWISALLRGTASIHDRVSTHLDSFSVARTITVAFFLLLLQGILEETASRAFPMRLWGHRSLAFRLVVPSIFFAAVHLAGEQFSLGRICLLFMGGLVLGMAYALTGNIWLTSGLHTGGNLALFSISGLWHAGAVVSVRGYPAIPNWLTTTIMLAIFSATLALQRRYRVKLPPGPIGPS